MKVKCIKSYFKMMEGEIYECNVGIVNESNVYEVNDYLFSPTTFREKFIKLKEHRLNILKSL